MFVNNTELYELIVCFNVVSDYVYLNATLVFRNVVQYLIFLVFFLHVYICHLKYIYLCSNVLNWKLNLLHISPP